ncbi:Molybdenum transport ATP-binding protein ModC (TC 3.A.1.8.1) [hydrothermal vent metagenome]|uniref:Molybdenum transport ATP-binding protein ModC (TC 3.A.1.8.1) n=1 Tax=hydrothermal vent metagenome TaxID=652676 RepID=A0A3B0SEY7_9ZZZZ
MKIALHCQLADFVLQVQTQLASNAITVLAGPSGAGKTTLLRCLAGFLPGSGEVHFGDKTLQSATTYIAPEQRQIGYVNQQGSLFPHLTVGENLDFAIHHASAAGPTRDDIVQGFGIGHLLERVPDTLSGGEVQRVCLARSLLAHPSLLLLDEPFAALDEEAKAKTAAVLAQVVATTKTPVLMVAHEFASLTRLAERVLYLQQGKLLGDAPLSQILVAQEFPFAARADACMVVMAKVHEHDENWGLTTVSMGRHQISIPAIETAKTKPVRLRIRAGDVSLSRRQTSNSSIINSLSVTIRELRQTGERPGQVLAILDAQDFCLLARITRKSVTELNLQEGQQVYARVKASAASVV